MGWCMFFGVISTSLMSWRRQTTKHKGTVSPCGTIAPQGVGQSARLEPQSYKGMCYSLLLAGHVALGPHQYRSSAVSSCLFMLVMSSDPNDVLWAVPLPDTGVILSTLLVQIQVTNFLVSIFKTRWNACNLWLVDAIPIRHVTSLRFSQTAHQSLCFSMLFLNIHFQNDQLECLHRVKKTRVQVRVAGLLKCNSHYELFIKQCLCGNCQQVFRVSVRTGRCPQSRQRTRRPRCH